MITAAIILAGFLAEVAARAALHSPGATTNPTKEE
jgi:hypothetical protein